MTKPSEEGQIWEWRAFGEITDELAAKIQSYPIRLGVSDIDGEDIYLVSPNSDQNVKFRKYPGGWVLKFKLLLETKTGAFELYNERPEFTYRLPVSGDLLIEAARLLAVELPETRGAASLNEQDFVKAFAQATPRVVECRVAKRRSQYQFENGWLELANVKFRRLTIRSISVHSRNLGLVKKMLDNLQLGDDLQAMNYLQACRRWG